jgi:hypothetical protein
MANAVETFFSKIGKWFQSVFKKAPAWNVVALSALNVIAPLFETITDLVDPALGAIATPIITTIQSKLGAASQLIASADVSTLPTVLQSIVADLPQIESLVNVEDAATKTKVTAAVTTITSELQAILAAIPVTNA